MDSYDDLMGEHSYRKLEIPTVKKKPFYKSTFALTAFIALMSIVLVSAALILTYQTSFTISEPLEVIGNKTFELGTVAPGDSLSDSITLINNGNKPLLFKINWQTGVSPSGVTFTATAPGTGNETIDVTDGYTLDEDQQVTVQLTWDIADDADSVEIGGELLIYRIVGTSD